MFCFVVYFKHETTDKVQTGTTSHDRMQPFLERTTSGTSEPPLRLIMQYHINIVDVSRLLNNIYHMLQEQSKRDQIL